MPPYDQQAKALHRLATLIIRAGLREPLAIALDALHPLDFLSSQAAAFVHPFVRGCAWEQYSAALMHEANWPELRRLLATTAGTNEHGSERN